MTKINAAARLVAAKRTESGGVELLRIKKKLNWDATPLAVAQQQLRDYKDALGKCAYGKDWRFIDMPAHDGIITLDSPNLTFVGKDALRDFVNYLGD